jgi:hypothetical protein
MKAALISAVIMLTPILHADDVSLCASIDSKEWIFKSVEGESLGINISAVAYDDDTNDAGNSDFIASVKITSGNTIYEFPMNMDGSDVNDKLPGLSVDERGQVTVITFVSEKKTVRLSFENDVYKSIKEKWTRAIRLTSAMNAVWPKISKEFRGVVSKCK